MLTKREFMLPEVPALQNPSENERRLLQYAMELKRSIAGIFRELNQPDVLVIDEATIDSAPIGGTTPAAGAFTTLTTSSYAKFGTDARCTAFSKSNAALGVGSDLDCTTATDGLICVRNNTDGGIALVTVDFTLGCAEVADASTIVTVGADPGAGSNQLWVTTNSTTIRVRNRYGVAKDVSVWYLLFGGTPA